MIKQPYQRRVVNWLLACFGQEIASDKAERSHRFVEEAIELAQAQGMTLLETIQLVTYVYGRPAGEPAQEVGGVMVTLAALCQATGIDMEEAAEAELTRVWEKIDRIREKQKAKPKFSVLPQ
jgi:sugar phosphate isomerase/epimerase